MIIQSFKKWWNDTQATAIAEFALIFPLMMTMLLGVFEVGNAISVNQKSIAASQIISDLLARNSTVDDDLIDTAILAGQLAVMPYDLDNMGVDIVSLVFDDDDDPQIVWRQTTGMTAPTDVLEKAEGLGTEGDGALVVTVQYNYDPFFGSMIVGEIEMQERTYARGRRTAVVCHVDDCEVD